MNKLILKSTIAALALATAPIAMGVVNAQTTQPSASSTAQTQRTNLSTVFLGKLATSLGITQEKLSSSLKAAGNATVDEALKNQDITKTQAERMRTDVNNGQYIFFAGARDGQPGRDGPNGGRDGGPGKGGPDGGPGLGGPGGSTVFDATAKILGLSSDELRTQLQSGKTISELAKAKNISETAVHDAAVTALKTQLAADVKAGKITQAQADEHLKQAQANANFGLQAGRGGPRR
jgi:hypothetical protein